MSTNAFFQNLFRVAMGGLLLFASGCADAPDEKGSSAKPMQDKIAEVESGQSGPELVDTPRSIVAEATTSPHPRDNDFVPDHEQEFDELAAEESGGGSAPPDELSLSAPEPLAVETIPPQASANPGDADQNRRSFRSATRPRILTMPSATAGSAAAEEESTEVTPMNPPKTESPVTTQQLAEDPAAGNPISKTVFYATDRKHRFGINSGDWLKVHFGAIVVGLIYLIAFASVFLTRRKLASGLVAAVALVGFLFLGQTSTVQWQKVKRLATNNDAIYLTEIREDARQPLDYGSCEVTIPPTHEKGKLESPSVLKLEFREDAQRHVVLQRVVRTSVDEFYSGVVEKMDQYPTRQAMVFIHGYNVSFDDAVKRTAQIAHDLNFEGAPICYSWTSHGALANYTRDMANADATVVALQSFLEQTVRRTGSSTIHLIAHSMGNRALLQALDRIAVGNPNTSNVFGQLVMAAPDVSVKDFRNRYADAARQLAESVTLYASSRDRALLASTEIHGLNRAGLAGENLVVLDGMDTIDVSEIDTSLIGHSYYGDHPELIRDLQALVELAQPASQRHWLTRLIDRSGSGYFRFAEAIRRAASPEGSSERR